MDNLPQRKRMRLSGYDYSRNGAYFVTICTQQRMHTLSEIIVGDGFPVPILTGIGNIAGKHISMIGCRFPTVSIDNYVIMPNHLHLILTINSQGDGTGNPSPTIGTIMAWFKYQTTKYANADADTAGNRIWQRSFHDHIIRNEIEYKKICEYIAANPMNWEKDCFYEKP